MSGPTRLLASPAILKHRQANIAAGEDAARAAIEPIRSRIAAVAAAKERKARAARAGAAPL